jgi:hypothetical protein
MGSTAFDLDIDPSTSLTLFLSVTLGPVALALVLWARRRSKGPPTP